MVVLTGLSPPVVVLQRLQQRGQHELDAVRAELAHDELGGVVGGGAHVLRAVAEAQQQVRQHVHDVRLEQAPQLVAQHLEAEQSAWREYIIIIILGDMTAYVLFITGDAVCNIL